jgi:streptomycin 6-kinase
LTLADHLAGSRDGPVEEAIEIAGELAYQLAVDPGPGILPLAESMPNWAEQLRGQVAGCPDALPGWAVVRALATIEHLAGDRTPTMIHGDLHFGNILRSHRTPWLTIDPKGWSGTAAFERSR